MVSQLNLCAGHHREASLGRLDVPEIGNPLAKEGDVVAPHESPMDDFTEHIAKDILAGEEVGVREAPGHGDKLSDINMRPIVEIDPSFIGKNASGLTAQVAEKVRGPDARALVQDSETGFLAKAQMVIRGLLNVLVPGNDGLRAVLGVLG
ncbi:MAG: hypothetical protein P8M78_01455, partial [Myxococcota bacterium]|nr:hypothetical protein [Myxococcota bacterium]